MAVVVQPEVDDALRAGRSVVALETAVLTHGLPRNAVGDALPDGGAGFPALDRNMPLNLAASRAMEQAVRDAGSVPATIAVVDGVVRVGLDAAALERLAADETAGKASVGRLSDACARGLSAGTTVSATLAVCRMPAAGPLRMMATGGIGGVHAGWTVRPDFSADLVQLRGTPVCLVCAGAKSILDLPATLEALEGLGVPVVGYGTDAFPRFHSAGDASLPVPVRADDPGAVAAICHAHWRTLAQTTAVLVTAPVPAAHAIDSTELVAAVADAEAAADARPVRGADRTPFLLTELARLTAGRSIVANVALLVNNATIAAAIGAVLATRMAETDAS